MKKLPRLVALAAVSTLALGSTACITIDRTSSEDEDSTDNGDEAPDEEENDEANSDLEALIGEWEVTDVDHGPFNGATLVVDDEANGLYSTSLYGDFEGPIVENEDGELILEGDQEDATGLDFELIYHEEDDTMTAIAMFDPSPSEFSHVRTE